MASPAPVSASFCVRHETQFMVKQDSRLTRKYTIKDSEGIPMFIMKSKFEWFDPPKRRIYDASSGKVLLLMKNDIPCSGTRLWLAFHGDSESESELRFTLRRKSPYSSSYVVFLPENSDSENPDFSIKKNRWWCSSFTIFSRGRPIAEAKAGWSRSSFFTVTVYPEVDQAFVAALVSLWTLELLAGTKASILESRLKRRAKNFQRGLELRIVSTKELNF